MTDTLGSTCRHVAGAACLSMLFGGIALAQPPLPNPPTSAQFMPRYDFHLAASYLLTDDEAFSFDTHFGGDFDLVDYVVGRATFTADYQAILGTEFRPFDPNQGNYTLEAATSFRAKGNEVFGALHHVSRHLGDRFKRNPIAWNEIDVRYLRQFRVTAGTIDLTGQAGKVIARANVDYSWNTIGDVTFRHPVNPHVGLFGRAVGRLVGVHPEVSGRDTQRDGHLEAGVRLSGEGGALELYGGYEAVIDADPFDLVTRHWGFLGFRLVTK